MLLELAVTSSAGARVARDAGAGRIELCSALELGGITPSQGVVEQTAEVGIPIHALVRCRPGGFRYDGGELEAMRRETVAVLRGGANGVVVGALDENGRLDLDAIARLTDAARDAGATAVIVHRAIDLTADPAREAERLAPLGVDGVLSSGGASRAVEGVEVIAAIAKTLPVIAGGGVAPDDVAALAAAGATAVHASAKTWVPEPAAVSLGSGDGGGHWITDPPRASALRRAVDAIAR